LTAIIDNEMLWRQFDKSLGHFGKALRNCPDELWERRVWEDEPGQWVARGFGTFWYLCYHTLFWLDLYLTGAEEGFTPPEPFALVEMEANETLPRTYTRAELLQYFDLCRDRCRETILGMTSDQANRLCRFPWGTLPFAELQLYNMRHVEEHAAQLHMFIGQHSKDIAG